ncbi:MAG: hypothetical protein L0H63_10085 [Nitrococcus sp.]|nr:hypothetical protein [Nitrococcus sp.]
MVRRQRYPVLGKQIAIQRVVIFFKEYALPAIAPLRDMMSSTCNSDSGQMCH